MSYIALYRKWRPLVFSDVVEQEHVVKTLKHSIITKRIAHAYLFCGTRGTGKTTMAKIFSRAINCLNPIDGDPCNECEVCRGIMSESILDVIEIDAASNNSVDNVREIRDEVIYAPSQARYKVYIIDEVHMLSTGAFNALLKTLEEPPSHVVFILATTDPHKLPATILSRCQRFDFRRITVESIVRRLERIAVESGVILQKEAAKLIAKMSDGALRDAISILDQCISTGNNKVSYDDVLSIVGIVNDSFIGDMYDAVGKRDISKVLKLVDTLVMDGKDIAQFVSDLIFYYRNVLICKIVNDPHEIIEAPTEAIQRMQHQSKAYSQFELTCIIKELSALESSLKWSTYPRILLEVALLKLCERNFSTNNDNMADRLSLLESRMDNLNFTAKPSDDQATIKKAQDPAPNKSSTPVRKTEAKKESGASTNKVKGILDNWNEILNELKSLGRMVAYTNLLDTRAVELDSKQVGIIFKPGSGFSKMIVSKAENSEAIESILSNKLGRQVRIKCLDENEFVQNSSTEETKEEDEFLDKLQNMASKLNVPLNIVDE